MSWMGSTIRMGRLGAISLSATSSYTTVMANTKVWCLLINQAKEHYGTLFKIEVSSTDYIDDLKVKVKLRKECTLDNVDADELVVWKCEDPRLTPTTKRTEMAELLKNMDFQDENMALTAGETVKSVNQIFVVQAKTGILISPLSSTGSIMALSRQCSPPPPNCHHSDADNLFNKP
ncbi:hypothetical protein EI94DRAFT_632016 [Lactarius quietus]|nr:hypothetical protein EI94DRAFT_632016 [Lactarius quietus]